MTAIFASDLDRTLIHPYRTLPAARRVDAPVAEIYEGRPITVCSTATLATLDAIVELGAFVAVTTRSLRQLHRVAPIWERARRNWAICANGATLLERGEVDLEWKATVDALCAGCALPEEARAALHAALGPCDEAGWLLRVRACDDRFLYAICDPERLPAGVAAAASEAMRPVGWEAVLHGRKLYLLPAGLTKLRCVEHLAERVGAARVLAAGDSLLDAELLAAADVAWCPRDAELVTWAAVPDGVRITAAEHVDGAEEIVREALQALSANVLHT